MPETIDCTPTKQGFKNIKRMLEEGKAAHKEKIAEAQAELDNNEDLSELMVEALEALIANRVVCIRSMEEGIVAAEKGIRWREQVGDSYVSP